MIKNLLFDLGGVVTDIERQRCVDALSALGMSNADEMIGLYVQSGPFLQLEAGAISAAEFRDAMREHMPEGVTDTQIDQALNAFIIGIPLHRLKAIRELRKTYRTYVLSNTNPIMYEGILAREFEKEGLKVDDYFDGVTVSYKAGCNKPAKEIFDYAVRTMGIVPEETLFLDDSQKNLDAAAKFGFQTALIPVGAEFMDVLRERLDF